MKTKNDKSEVHGTMQGRLAVLHSQGLGLQLHEQALLDLSAARRQLRELREQALIACLHLKAATAAIDVAMTGPSTVERGEKIGKIATNIDFIKDSLWHFGLGRPLPMRYKSRKRLAEKGAPR